MKNKIKLSSLARALANDEFVFHFQPVISLFTGKICGAESLIRWQQPDGSLIPPGDFIPLAEETGFITEITQEMLPKIVQALNTLNLLDDKLTISFNISAKDIEDEDFLDYIHACIDGKLDYPQNLCLEITETSFLNNNPHTYQVLEELDQYGITLVLDDFSAGYTSFSTLTSLPLKAIKIALEITQRAAHSRLDFRLLRHLISTAHQLRLDIVAEGVEDMETHSLILANGCTHAQGFYYSPGIPFNQLISLIKQGPVWSEYPFGLEYLALIDHIDFRRDIIRASLMIYNNRDQEIRERALARLPEVNEEKCLFGEWYKKVSPHYKNDPNFDKLGERHHKFHKIANKLLDKAHEDVEYKELDQLINDFSKQSKIALEILHDLENERLKDYFAP